MPVIGRLDSQVNDVLIEPVGRQRRRDEHDERDPRPAADEARPAPPVVPSRDAGGTTHGARGDSHDEAHNDAHDDAHGDDARRGEQLPVWLL